MITEIISLILVLFIFTFWISATIMTCRETTRNDLKDSITGWLWMTALLLFVGAFAGIPSFFGIVKDTHTEYIEPTYIVRTNDITHVIYISAEKVYAESYTDARYWNATNIFVKVMDGGKNIWGIELKDKTYEMGIFNRETK